VTVVTTSRPILVVLGILGVLATGSAGCASGARVGMGPVLRIPEAPPRVVTTLPVSAPEPAPAEAEPTTTERTDATAGAAEDKPPRSVRRPPPAEDSAEVASDAVQVQRELTSAPDEDTDRRTVMSTLASTNALLDRLDRSDLDAAARAQFDTARRFLDQAEEALAADSLVFALSLGQKAQALAHGL